MKLLWTWIAAIWAGIALLAANAAAQALPVVPFSSEPSRVSDTATATQLGENGRSALANGLISLSVEYFQKALALPGLDATAKDNLNLDLATAYLAQGQSTLGAAALNAVASTGTPAFALRKALLASRDTSEGHWDEAAAQLAKIDPTQLSSADLPLYYSAQAILAESRKDAAAARVAWQQAIEKASATPLQKYQLQAALWRGQILLSQEATPEAADNLLRQQADPSLSLSLRAQFAVRYALVLEKLGRHAEALGVVNRWLRVVDLDSKNLDTLRLELVLLDSVGAAPSDPVRDQEQLKFILKDSIKEQDPDRESVVQMQQTALALLESRLQQSNDLEGLKQFVDELISNRPDHPLLKQLYLLQAHLALALKQYDAANTAAKELLKPNRFPPVAGRDVVKEDALRLLAFVAYNADPNNRQYLVAADYLIDLYKLMPPDVGAERVALTGLLADMFFLKGDYRNAANYYSGLMKEASPLIPRRDLLMRTVQSEILSGQLDEAINRLDQTVWTDLEPNDRWRAEWNVLTALRDHGRADDAFKRLGRLLDPNRVNLLDPELRLRLLWLDASLAVAVGDSKAADKALLLYKVVGTGSAENLPGITPALRDQLTANALLLQGEAAAQAGEAAGRAGDKDGQARHVKEETQFFEDLRKRFEPKTDPKTGLTIYDPATADPAIYSLYYEASEFDAKQAYVDAQRKMQALQVKYPNSSFAPWALYAAAQFSAKVGGSDQNQNAINLLAKFVQIYPDHPLMFEVRWLQADLYRSKNNKDGLNAARDIYEHLLKTYSDKPPEKLALVEVARADCLVSLASLADASAAQRKEALDELAHLVNRDSLPVDARVKEGYKRGYLLAAGSSPDSAKDAAEAYWSVINLFLLGSEQMRGKLFLSAEGSYWMSQCFFALADIYKSQGKTDDAAKVLQRIIDYNLSGKKIAEAQLKQNSTVGLPVEAPVSAPPPPPVAPVASAASTPAATSPASVSNAPAPSPAPPVATTPPQEPAPAADSATADGTAR